MLNTGNTGNNVYNPDYFEYDDELPEGQISERVVLSNDPVPVQIGVIRTIGTMKGEDAYCYEWADEAEEDDARIEEFLASMHQRPSKPQKRLCMFYQTNSCRNGTKCQFEHAFEDEMADSVGAKGSYSAEDDKEC